LSLNTGYDFESVSFEVGDNSTGFARFVVDLTSESNLRGECWIGLIEFVIDLVEFHLETAEDKGLD